VWWDRAVPLTLSAPAPAVGQPKLDVVQRAAVDHRGGALLVRGAPGSGKTTVALAAVAERLSGGELGPDEVLLLAPTRRAAAELRDRLSARVRRTSGHPVVRTAASAAFALLRSRAALLGEAPPTLISGPEQDLVLAELLAGHAAGEGVPVVWPPRVPEAALRLSAFRDELRDLLMRAAERGLRPADLARLGERFDRPEWVSAAQVYGEYLDVTRLRAATPGGGARYDVAVVVDEAAEALQAWHDEVPGAPRPGWRLVVVDDYQEATAATARLLHVLAAGGTELLLLADPDTAVQTFRGASPALVERASLGPAGSELGAFAADELVLPTVWRHGAAVRAAVRAVSGEIRGPGRAHREADAPRGTPGRVDVHFLGSPAQEAAYVAYTLRAARLLDAVPWSAMAVVARSGDQVAELRRSLLGAGVPVAVLGSDVALRSEPAVRPLLLALRCSLRPESMTPDDAVALLLSPLGGMDPVTVRRLRRALRSEEAAGGGSRSSDPLLVEVLADADRASTLPASLRRPVSRVATVLAAGRDALAAADPSPPEVLWALWSRARLADGWRRSALAGGLGGARSDRDLDAVLALFAAAEQFSERLPGAPVAAFLEHVQSQDLPADSLAAQGRASESVSVVTPAGAAGREWDVVVVAGVEEGVWPDLRLRDSLLGAQHLVEVVAGRVQTADRDRRAGPGFTPGAAWAAAAGAEARAAVLDDELRAFTTALSRARSHVVVTAVRDTDHQPSGMVDLLDQGPAEGEQDPRVTTVPVALDLRALVAQCRSELEGTPDAGPDHPAARLLARLAGEGVAGADPSRWYGVLPLSTTDPLWPDDATVPLSPSKLESAATCALRWALEAAGGTAADSGEQSLGTLIHSIAGSHPTGSREVLMSALDARWHELGTTDGWVGSVQRRRADAMVGHLAAYLATRGEPVAVEETFAVRIGRVVLRGSVDRLERVRGDDGRTSLRVVDLKTGRSAVGRDEATRHPQLGAYQLAVDAGAFESSVPGATSGGASLVYVGTTNKAFTTREQPALAGDHDPGWAGDLLDQVAETVSRSAVAATANDLCRSCPVTRSCPVSPDGRVVGA
jgi:superfamily I DNA/RNA helicase